MSYAFPQFEFLFADRELLDISDATAVNDLFTQNDFYFCVNCAAYTAVDKAEVEKEIAFRVNAVAPGVLASACNKTGAGFIHLSTDYVFNGKSSEPYTEEMDTDPVNYYGYTKLEGERNCMKVNEHSIIIRTAWVYSEYGNNFVKTMLRLMNSRDAINVVNDQVGAPTYAKDLAEAVMKIICFEQRLPGIYHYSNSGRISWYDFAVAIRDIAGLHCAIHPITTEQYPTPAARPSFSLLDTTKIQSIFGIGIPSWRESLSYCLQRVKSLEG